MSLEWPVTHATRGRDGRQECRERGYYHLHRHLNDFLLHTFSLFTVHYSLFVSEALSPDPDRRLRHHQYYRY